MNRAMLGSWGADLSDDDFARAVAALGVFGAASHRQSRLGAFFIDLYNDDWPRFEDLFKTLGLASDLKPIEVSSTLIAELAGRDLPGERLRDLWVSLTSKRAEPRLEVIGQLMPATLALADLLSSPAVGADAVYIRQDEPEVNVVWNWPLRIGLLPGFRTSEANKLADIPWPELVEVSELREGQRECDLLLLPASLPVALAAVLGLRWHPQADCILVLGSFGTSPSRALPLIQSLRSWSETGGVAVASVPRRLRKNWFVHFVRELSHDLPLDVAIRRAPKNLGEELAPPLVVASRRLIEATRISVHVARVVEDLEAVPPQPEEPIDPAIESRLPTSVFAEGSGVGLRMPSAEDFKSALHTTVFDSELRGATEIAWMKRAMPPSRRIVRRMAKMDGGGAEERSLLSQTFDSKDRTSPVNVLTSGTSYVASLWIGKDREEVVAAEVSFPSHLLPPDPRGHRLTVVFAPLAAAEGEPVSQPQTATIFLPPEGDSERCAFTFRTSSSGAAFRARVIVLYQNRVLQTLRYGQSTESGTISIASEAEVYRIDDLDGRRRFDAALVFNENPGGSPGVFTIVDGTAIFTAPVGLEKTIDHISQLLGQLTASVNLPNSLKDPVLSQLLFDLANHGHTMWMSLGLAEKAPELAAAKRIHVVATKPGEFVPVEFFYPRDAPEKKDICSHAMKAIKRGESSRCTSADPSEEICPLEFWGFSRVIERSPFSQPGTSSNATPPHIDLFRQAVIGVSNNVLAASVDAITKTSEALTKGRVTRAEDWNDWKTAVAASTPSLLVLLPHSLESTKVKKLPALEIGGDELPVSWLNEAHLRRPGSSDTPVVLLLGCSTQLSEAAYQNFAEAFKQLRASVVLSTLSLILGRHATSFAQALLEELKAREGSDTTFGDVLLDVKRKRVGKGDPFVISLVSYGDSEIRV